VRGGALAVAAIVGMAAGPGCEGRQDGALRISFLLQAPPAGETRLLPPEAETGVPVAAFGQAQGRCDCDVVGRSLRCTVEGLPAVSPVTKEALSYQLRFLLWYAPLTARFDATALDRDPGGRDPDAPPPPMVPPLPRALVGPVTPDPLGHAELSLPATDLPLARVAGGELQILAPAPTGDPARYTVIDGRVGNLPDEAAPTTATPPPTTGGGHVH
jgi:hypothetical protein